MTVTDEQKSASYHYGIVELLRAAYLRELSPLETSECKTEFPTFDDWYHLLTIDQKHRVDVYLADQYVWAGLLTNDGCTLQTENNAMI